ncbi:hypothetical protein Tco_0850045 [Tanacetum coccineum]
METYSPPLRFPQNAMFHERTKHINVMYHFIRETVESKEIEVAKIGAEDNATDSFTMVVLGYEAMERDLSEVVFLQRRQSWSYLFPLCAAQTSLSDNGITDERLVPIAIGVKSNEYKLAPPPLPLKVSL